MYGATIIIKYNNQNILHWISAMTLCGWLDRDMSLICVTKVVRWRGFWISPAHVEPYIADRCTSNQYIKINWSVWFVPDPHDIILCVLGTTYNFNRCRHAVAQILRWLDLLLYYLHSVIHFIGYAQCSFYK